MTFEKMLDETRIKYAEGEFRPDMRPPYLVYVKDCETICADSVVVDIVGEITLYLATARGDSASEKAVEDVLNAHKIAYSKEQDWIGGKQMVYLSEYVFEARAEW